MLNMMIVDDESIIRNGIKSSINWCEYGINICGEAADGIEALEKLKLLKPDIVIMDIRMPKLDGLKVCQEVIKEHPGLEIIILSGYDEFEFKEETGINFIEWINRFRVCKAKELLEQTDKNITLIAEEVGYNDYRYFSYNFKKYFGISPRKYRKKIIMDNY